MTDLDKMSSMSNPVQFANVCNRLSQLDDFGSFSPKDPQYQVLTSSVSDTLIFFFLGGGGEGCMGMTRRKALCRIASPVRICCCVGNCNVYSCFQFFGIEIGLMPLKPLL